MTRLWSWWRRWWSRARVVDECEVCAVGLTVRDRHVLVAAQDDRALEITYGGTAVSAVYCRRHCPGGCMQGCATLVGGAQG